MYKKKKKRNPRIQQQLRPAPLSFQDIQETNNSIMGDYTTQLPTENMTASDYIGSSLRQLFRRRNLIQDQTRENSLRQTEAEIGSQFSINNTNTNAYRRQLLDNLENRFISLNNELKFYDEALFNTNKALKFVDDLQKIMRREASGFTVQDMRRLFRDANQATSIYVENPDGTTEFAERSNPYPEGEGGI